MYTQCGNVDIFLLFRIYVKSIRLYFLRHNWFHVKISVIEKFKLFHSVINYIFKTIKILNLVMYFAWIIHFTTKKIHFHGNFFSIFSVIRLQVNNPFGKYETLWIKLIPRKIRAKNILGLKEITNQIPYFHPRHPQEARKMATKLLIGKLTAVFCR